MAWTGGRITLAGLALGAAGCNWGGNGDEPLSAERFSGSRSAPQAIAAPVDEPGALMYNQVNVQVRENQPRLGGLLDRDEDPGPPVREVSSTVREVVGGEGPAATRPARAAAGESPSTAPAERTAFQPAPGHYYTLGGVVAEVNGQPIYANRVLNILARPLQSKAHEVSREEFPAAARELIEHQIDELVRAEVFFAAAQRNLGPDEKLLAESLTMAWRNRQITQAGGSLQQAIHEAAARGEDFDLLLQEQYRLFMTQVYVQKKLMPRVQLSADDLRRYYDSHLDQFTQFDEASFRLIRIDPRRMETREAALDRITTIWRQLQRGEGDFATVAGQINHDAFLLKNNGLVPGPIQRGSYREAAVEEAVWKTPVGQITEIITGADGAYYIALVESKREGRVMRFEEERVQEAIRRTLNAQQLRSLMDQANERLARSASVRRSPAMVATAVEMAVQNYDRWRATTPAAPAQDDLPPRQSPVPAPEDLIETK